MGNRGKTTNKLASKIRRLLSWVRSRPKKFTIPIAALIVVGIFLGGYQGINFYKYTQENPNFCKSCHTMEKAWDRWLTSEHRSIACHSCHELGVLEGTGILLAVASGLPEKVGKHAAVPDEACKQCHESDNPRWLQVAATAGHQVHTEEENIACTKCHSVSIHRFAAPGPICSTCHVEKHVEINGMAAMHCTTCHQYLAIGEVRGEQLLPRREDCLDCHLATAGQEVTWPADAPMQFPCGRCHQPHEQAKPVADCLSCHPNTKGLHEKGAHSVSTCQTCHQPHQWQVTGRETCLSCHPDRIEHNSGLECAPCHSFQASLGLQ